MKLKLFKGTYTTYTHTRNSLILERNVLKKFSWNRDSAGTALVNWPTYAELESFFQDKSVIFVYSLNNIYKSKQKDNTTSVRVKGTNNPNNKGKT